MAYPIGQVAFTTNTSAGTPFQTNDTTDVAYTSAANHYIPLLFAKKVLKNFYASSVFSEITNTDYEGEFKNSGDSIKIRQAPTFTARTYTKALSLTYDTPSNDSLEMNIDQALYIGTAVEDVEQVVSDVDLMNMYAEEANNTIKVAIDTNVLLAMSTGGHASNKGATAGAISSSVDLGTDTTTDYVGVSKTNALDKIVEIEQVLNEQNLGTNEFWIVIPSWYASKLKLSDLKAADFSGDSTGTVRTGLIGQINGMKVYVSNNLPNTSTTSNSNYAVLAGNKMSSSFAMQLSKVETVRMESTFGEKWRTLWVFGRKVVRPEGLANMFCRPA